MLSLVGGKLPIDIESLKCVKCDKAYPKHAVRDGVCIDCIRYAHNGLKFDLMTTNNMVKSFIAKMTGSSCSDDNMSDVFQTFNLLASQWEIAYGLINEIFNEETADPLIRPNDIQNMIREIRTIVFRHKATSEWFAAELLKAKENIRKHNTTLSVEQGTRKLDL